MGWCGASATPNQLSFMKHRLQKERMEEPLTVWVKGAKLWIAEMSDGQKGKGKGSDPKNVTPMSHLRQRRPGNTNNPLQNRRLWPASGRRASAVVAHTCHRLSAGTRPDGISDLPRGPDRIDAAPAAKLPLGDGERHREPVLGALRVYGPQRVSYSSCAFPGSTGHLWHRYFPLSRVREETRAQRNGEFVATR